MVVELPISEHRRAYFAVVWLAVLTPLAGALSPAVGQIRLGDRARLEVQTPLGYRSQAIRGSILGSEHVVALEGETNALLLIGPDGSSRARLETSGRGTAVLQYPVSITSTPNDDVLVLDAQVPRVARYSVKDEVLSYESIVALRGLNAVSSVCEMNGETLVLGLTYPLETSPLVHRVTRDGELISSFGNGFGLPTEMGRLVFGTGTLLCLQGADLIVVAPDFYPELRAYDSLGRLRWQVTLTDFSPMSVEEPQPNSFRYVLPADGIWDHVTALFPILPDGIAIQISRRQGRGADSSPVSLRTLVFSLRDGRLLSEQSDLPSVRAAGRGTLFAIEADDSAWLIEFEAPWEAGR